MNDEITTFIISSGNNPNFQDCLDALNKQTLQTEIKIIKDVFPISKAFQQMLEECKTKYFCQIDEDMILYPNAIEKLYNAIKETDNKTPFLAFKLHDAHLNFDLYGVKIYKYDIMKKYGFYHGKDTVSGALDTNTLLRNDGYVIPANSEVIGLHSPKWNKELIFDRYNDLIDKTKKYHYDWMTELPIKLLEKVKQEPTENNIFALLGTMASLLDSDSIRREKNTGKYYKKYLQIMEWLVRPETVTLAITSKCSLRCKFCLRQHEKLDEYIDMPINVAETTLKKFPSIKNVCLAGRGEPLLGSTFTSIMKFLERRKIKVGIITNGVVLKNKVEELSKYSNLLYVSVSLNAVSSEEHKEVSGVPDMFDKIIEGIKKSVDAGIKTKISFVCYRSNLNKVPEIIRLAYDLKVNSLDLINLLPHFELNEENKNEFLKEVLFSSDQKKINQWKKIPESSIVGSYPVLLDITHKKTRCISPWNCLQIDGNGSIGVCKSVYPPCEQNGSIFDKEIWLNDYCKKMRNNFYNEEIPLYCKYCFRQWENTEI